MLNYICRYMCRDMPKLQIFIDPKDTTQRVANNSPFEGVQF